MAFIEVKNVNKEFQIAKNQPGIWGSVKSLFHREYTVKQAVRDMSFSLESGEVVGYIGPNGAGKSTTIKMLSGVLTPSSGEICVADIVPYKQRKENALHIGAVFGQRSQLYWDLPISDTFSLYQKLYEIPDAVYRRNRDLSIELMGMADIMDQPVRQLSLGQKMKANLALAMLHDPKVLYLDEPTIGLDVMSKKVLRQSIRELNREKNTTVILTTHDMDDIEAVCGRLILIDQGSKLFDGSLEEFKRKYEQDYTVKLEFDALPSWRECEHFSLLSTQDNVWTIQVTRRMTAKEALMLLIEWYNPGNLAIQPQRIEDIIASIFTME